MMANPRNSPAIKRIEKDIWINFLDMWFYLRVEIEDLGEVLG
jgi:hypothetical protein